MYICPHWYVLIYIIFCVVPSSLLFAESRVFVFSLYFWWWDYLCCYLYQFVSCLIFNYSLMGWAVYKIDWFVAKMYIYEVLSYFCDGDVCYLFSVMVKVFCLWWILQMFVGLLMAVAVCLYHHNFFVQQFEWEVSVSFAGVCTGFV